MYKNKSYQTAVRVCISPKHQNKKENIFLILAVAFRRKLNWCCMQYQFPQHRTTWLHIHRIERQGDDWNLKRTANAREKGGDQIRWQLRQRIAIGCCVVSLSPGQQYLINLTNSDRRRIECLWFLLKINRCSFCRSGNSHHKIRGRKYRERGNVPSDWDGDGYISSFPFDILQRKTNIDIVNSPAIPM